MFPEINSINDIKPHVAEKKEIRFSTQPNGATVCCYMFMDSHTFDSPEALECRGIAFDRNGQVISRPLNKFFNVGEKPWLALDRLLERDDIVGIYEKLDGSMIATAWVDGKLAWRSKKSFSSDVVKLAEAFLETEEGAQIKAFAHRVACNGLTAIFELTHPDARIVVAHERPALRLLHVRDNRTGEYVMLDPSHSIHEWIAEFHIPTAKRMEGMTLERAVESLLDMTNAEGYVLQFKNGDMAKIKCPWYARLHKSIAFMRERDIADLALKEELDDVKAALTDAGMDLTQVEEVETRLKNHLLAIEDALDAILSEDGKLERKDFAIKHSKHPLFGLAMARYLGKEEDVKGWYAKTRLKTDFTLRVLLSDAAAEAMEG